MTTTTPITPVEARPPTVTTGHVGLTVTDLARSVTFYAGALGLTVSGRSEAPGRRFAFLSDRERLVLTLWEQGSRGYDPLPAGLHHLSFQVSSADDVRRAQERLRGMGAEFVHDGVVAHGEGASSGGLFFLDPDGTRLEIYSPDAGEGAPAPVSDAPTCGFF
jgi:catechol 2,3-dioxygenase-like lactoylglutathione lyase family enzyme